MTKQEEPKNTSIAKGAELTCVPMLNLNIMHGNLILLNKLF